MGLFKNNKKVGLISDVIRCDEPSYLIWKWHPDGTQPGEHKREYSIRWGSSLRVKDGEVAVFVYKQKNGIMQDYIVGPYDEKIKTANFPILSGIIGKAFGGDTPFQAEIYFVNLANVIQVKFGIPFFDVSDPRYPDYTVPVAVRGAISFKIDDYREFIKLHRLQTFNLDDFYCQVRDAISRYVKDAVSNAPSSHNIPVVQIEAKTAMINDTVELDIKDRLKETFGVVVSGVDISTIEVDKSSYGYKQLKAITVDVTTALVQGQTEANIENYSESLRIQRQEGQYSQHMATQTANIGAFRIEKQAEVGVAGAKALGQMGSNGAGNVDLGGNGAGFNPAAMMASIAVGGVVGQNIASVMGNVMPNNESTPPPIPTVAYNVAKDGVSTGPFDMATLTLMATSGELKPETLVWKIGMTNWVRADLVEELKCLFAPKVPPME